MAVETLSAEALKFFILIYLIILNRTEDGEFLRNGHRLIAHLVFRFDRVGWIVYLSSSSTPCIESVLSDVVGTESAAPDSWMLAIFTAVSHKFDKC